VYFVLFCLQTTEIIAEGLLEYLIQMSERLEKWDCTYSGYNRDRGCHSPVCIDFHVTLLKPATGAISGYGVNKAKSGEFI
jgi:hypothetical protein